MSKMVTNEEFAAVLPHFRKSREVMQMRKRCRLDIEQKQAANENCEEAKQHLVIIDAELVRRGLRKK